jgi:PhzF family phenazine biosynthesis protein
MKIPIYVVDAFASKRFTGNPAAVCPLESWLSDSVLQNIAAENNLAETAFFIKAGNDFHIRWFTPKAEVDLCGHATLATAYTLFELLNYKQNVISFQSRSGILTVKKNNDWFMLNFPVDKIEKTETCQFLQCFDKKPIEAYQGLADYMLIFSDQQAIESMKPNLEQIASFEKRGIIITAKGNDTDFVSRYFAPAYGINEDPVTGSAHTTLTPYWSKKLGKINLTAKQLSQRGGFLKCSLLNERVEISGQAALYLTGEIEI